MSCQSRSDCVSANVATSSAAATSPAVPATSGHESGGARRCTAARGPSRTRRRPSPRPRTLMIRLSSSARPAREQRPDENERGEERERRQRRHQPCLRATEVRRVVARDQLHRGRGHVVCRQQERRAEALDLQRPPRLELEAVAQAPGSHRRERHDEKQLPSPRRLRARGGRLPLPRLAAARGRAGSASSTARVDLRRGSQAERGTATFDLPSSKSRSARAVSSGGPRVVVGRQHGPSSSGASATTATARAVRPRSAPSPQATPRRAGGSRARTRASRSLKPAGSGASAPPRRRRTRGSRPAGTP